MFDVNNFVSTETDVTLEENYTPIPVNEYMASITDVQAARLGKNESPALQVEWTIEKTPELEELFGEDNVTIRQTFWLDIDESGALSSGKNKNVALGKLRGALGQNNGQPWSPSHLFGSPATLLIDHSVNNDTGNIYPIVKSVKAS